MRGTSQEKLELWGGIEGSVARVGETYYDQFRRSEHDTRADRDLERIADLGIRTLRYPLAWERVAPDGDLGRADWSWSDARLEKLRALGIRPIVGLLHHGSGPRHTSLIDPEFPDKFAAFADAVACRYPWVTDWTPVNEPLTTARFSGLYGHWYPHGTDEATFTRAFLGELKGTVRAMRAIREHVPNARLVQTEDMGRTWSTPALDYQAWFENERRWATFDLLCGRVTGCDHHRMYGHLLWPGGASEDDLRWLAENPCPPDIIGLNHYLTSERFLDERLERYPPHTHGGNGRDAYADVEAVRVLENGCAGPRLLLAEAWERFGLPLAITEAHLGATREEQLRWLRDVWNDALAARADGADVRAVTVWSLLGAFDWDSLMTRHRNAYESGAFDVRALAPAGSDTAGPERVPRPTALAGLCRALAAGDDDAAARHPVLAGDGWWRRPARLLYPPEAPEGSPAPVRAADDARPILICGGTRGMLAHALRVDCEIRGLRCVVVGRDELDIAHRTDVEAALAKYDPWAVVNAAGFASVAAAEHEKIACLRDNAKGPAVLAAACARRGVRLALLSSPHVFDGQKRPDPYVESDRPRPRGVYGTSKALMESRALHVFPGGTLVVRSGAFFGPWDERNFLTTALRRLAAGEWVEAASDEFLSPVYLPDLTRALLDLLIDGEHGLWHLAHAASEKNEVWSRAALIRRAAEIAGLDTGLIRAAATGSPDWLVLGSERTLPLLPPLEAALSHFVDCAAERWRVSYAAAVPAAAEARPLAGAAATR